MNDYESPLRRFGALVMADTALQKRLAEIGDLAEFADAVAQSAFTLGLPLPAERVLAALSPGRAELSRWMTPVAQGSAWPPQPWLPIQVNGGHGGFFVDWAYFGTRPLTEPFFEGSIRCALRWPFVRLSQYRMRLSDLVARTEGTQSLKPSGFVFHMSRCGSTLTSQMLAALPRAIVVSEAAPVDAAVQLEAGEPDLAGERAYRLLAAMVAAYGRPRAGDERHYVVKLDSWHALALPLFARAFPAVPWVFLYRDPVEVLVSQARAPGAQMVPGIVPASRYGIEDFDGVPDAEYHARVLDKICRAAVENAGSGRALFVNYRELPEAVFTRIMPHFGIACDDSARAAMRTAAERDAKAPSFAFAADSAGKQSEASDELRVLAERHVGAVYRELEALSKER